MGEKASVIKKIHQLPVQRAEVQANNNFDSRKELPGAFLWKFSRSQVQLQKLPKRGHTSKTSSRVEIKAEQIEEPDRG